MKKSLKNVRNWLGVFVATFVMGLGYYLDSLEKKETHSEPVDLALTAEALPFKMTEVSKRSGLHFFHGTYGLPEQYKNVAPIITSDTATVAVADYDNDNYPDIYINSARLGTKSALFRNNGNGTFTDVTDKAGLGINSVGGCFFDFNNDGFKDLLVIRWQPYIYQNNGKGTFKDVSQTLGFTHDESILAATATVVDYDNDGYLDLVFASRWPIKNGVAFMPNSIMGASNGGPVTVYKNIKGQSFVKIPDALGINHRAFARAIGVYDIRGTGRPDLWFANDFGHDKVYFNEGSGRFKDISEKIKKNLIQRRGMNADFADVDNDGHPMVFVSHEYRKGIFTLGNTLWKWKGGDEFEEISVDRGVNRCGWAWGGKWIDLNNDGHLDLVVGNGYISNNPKKDFWFPFLSTTVASPLLLYDTKNWPPLRDSSWSGFQQACVFLNDGTGHFRNVVNATGMANELSDERGLAAIDYLNSGTQSLAISNQQQPIRFYKIESKTGAQWIGFKLVGTVSNRDAFGAQIRLTLKNGKVLSRQLQTMNAYGSQSDPRLHFGLGADPEIDKIQLRWPSGKTQELSKQVYALNHYHTIVEPK
jgi:enediyne biosynthesis protein E4